MSKPGFGQLVLFGTLLFLVLARPTPPEPEPPLAMELDRDRIRTFGVLLKIASEEMIAVADSENIEEHLIDKSEQIFDDFAEEADFPGPDRITKPLARKMVRPVVKSIIRYVDKKGQELSVQEGDFGNE